MTATVCDAARAAGVGRVHRVLGEDHRIVVGERDARGSPTRTRRAAAIASGDAAIREPVHLARLRDVPVLAELAGEVAAGGAERQHARAGKKWLSGFFSIGSTQKPDERP